MIPGSQPQYHPVFRPDSHLSHAIVKPAPQIPFPDNPQRLICFFQGYFALFNRTQKSQVYFMSVMQLCSDQPGQPLIFRLVTDQHKFTPEQALPDPVPALELS